MDIITVRCKIGQKIVVGEMEGFLIGAADRNNIFINQLDMIRVDCMDIFQIQNKTVVRTGKIWRQYLGERRKRAAGQVFLPGRVNAYFVPIDFKKFDGIGRQLVYYPFALLGNIGIAFSLKENMFCFGQCFGKKSFYVLF